MIIGIYGRYNMVYGLETYTWSLYVFYATHLMILFDSKYNNIIIRFELNMVD